MNNLYTHNTTRLVDNKFTIEQIANFCGGDYENRLSFLALKQGQGDNTYYDVFLAVEEEININHSFLISERRLNLRSKGFHRVFGKETPRSVGVESLRVYADQFDAIRQNARVFESIEEIAVAMGNNVAYYYGNPK